VRGWIPYATTFAAFLTRAYDFIRMAAVSRASIKLAGSHAGVSIGEDGPSQMGLEDIAALRAVHGSTVLSPCDANQAAWLTGAMADIEGSGLGDAVLSALAEGGEPLPAVRKLAVGAMAGSATPAEQLELAGIDMASIAGAAAVLVAGRAA